MNNEMIWNCAQYIYDQSSGYSLFIKSTVLLGTTIEEGIGEMGLCEMQYTCRSDCLHDLPT